eukprot:CAMPEP_0198284436 /NCGR_PEP_ID=MMETSP1449-20131203/3907_1 /TAXON_ID=420275 /ORGANISM="Attheya septentrionalis, Strain CCMP2084" /LENGTH=312 /DNA_ID=CAMNT_0043981499 /DNA_START=200 /DNA_END=1138 /DNA_ORIENTATION=+
MDYLSSSQGAAALTAAMMPSVSALKQKQKRTLVVATRIHLGKSSSPPAQEFLDQTVASFYELAKSCGATGAAIAVDPAPKLPNYSLQQAIELACSKCSSTTTKQKDFPELTVLPVSPWGNFVPALNALVVWACHLGVDLILFVSAETSVTADTIQRLCDHVDSETTLVAGAALPGHDYHASLINSAAVELTGRTTPWNTCAVWNVPKLALTGFPLVSEGLHPMDPKDSSNNNSIKLGPSGVEEASAVAVLQQMLSPSNAVAKLVQLPNIEWSTNFDSDPERKQWHEQKMKSKVERASHHLSLLGLSGTVHHC